MKEIFNAKKPVAHLLHGNVTSLSIGIIFLLLISAIGTTAILHSNVEKSAIHSITPDSNLNGKVKTIHSQKQNSSVQNNLGNGSEESSVAFKTQPQIEVKTSSLNNDSPTSQPTMAYKVIAIHRDVAERAIDPTSTPEPSCRPGQKCLNSDSKCIISEKSDLCPQSSTSQPHPTEQKSITPTTQPQITPIANPSCHPVMPCTGEKICESSRPIPPCE